MTPKSVSREQRDVGKIARVVGGVAQQTGLPRRLEISGAGPADDAAGRGSPSGTAARAAAAGAAGTGAAAEPDP